MKKKTKIIISVILLIFIILVISLWVFYKFVAKPDFIMANTELQMYWLEGSINSFRTEKGRLPVSLEEIVKAGDLPEKDPLYYCPMKHHTLGTYEDIHYTQCEFEISFEPNEVRICIPEKVFMFHKKRFGMHEHHKRCMIVTKDGEYTSE